MIIVELGNTEGHVWEDLGPKQLREVTQSGGSNGSTYVFES